MGKALLGLPLAEQRVVSSAFRIHADFVYDLVCGAEDLLETLCGINSFELILLGGMIST